MLRLSTKTVVLLAAVVLLLTTGSIPALDWPIKEQIDH